MHPCDSVDTPIAQRRLLFDGLRGIAAIAVVVYHFTSHTDFRALRSAYFAVDLFFCLSGFVLAEVYSRRLTTGLPASVFLIRRLIRLYPLYFAGIVIGAAALCLKTAIGQANYSVLELARAIQYNLLFLPYLDNAVVSNLSPSRHTELFPTNVAAWSLFFEIFVNLVFARVAGVRAKYFYCIAILSFIIYLDALAVYKAQPGWSIYNYLGGFPRVFYGFFAGVAVESLIRRQTNSAHGLALPAWSPGCGAAIMVGLIGLFASPAGLTYLFSLLLAPLIVYCAARVVVGGRFGALCAGLGWLSYPLYCLHCPIFSLIEGVGAWSGVALTPATLAMLAGAATFAAAAAVTYWIEEPTRHFLSVRFAARLAKTSPVPVLIVSAPDRAP
jgi:peptidoglycan/LPS O-acetylase OafA/YrhL